MYPFLDRVDLAALDGCLRRVCARQGTEISEGLGREQIYSVFFALAGFELLLESEVRHVLVASLPVEQIRSFAVRSGVSYDGKVFDVVSRICVKPWRARSPIVPLFSDVFGIPPEFLPTTASRDSPVEVVTPFEPSPPLFDYQEVVASHVFQGLDATPGSARMMVQLPTGAGKTRAALEGLLQWWTRTDPDVTRSAVLWLAHTEELCDQAIDAFTRLWATKGDRQVRAVCAWGAYRIGSEDVHGSYVVASYGKLVSLRRRDPDLFRRLLEVAGVVVIDEAHRALAPTIRSLLEEFAKNETSLLGLTATPGRGVESSRENKALARLFGSRLVTADSLGDDPVSTLQERGILSLIQRVVLETKTEVNLGKSDFGFQKVAEDLPPRVLSRLARNAGRNRKILDIVQDQVESGRSTLVFACSVDHARELALLAATRGSTASFVDCRMRRTQRRRVIQAFRAGDIDVLFNYGVLSTGFDAPNVQTIVIARPTSSIVLYSQMIGRGLRGGAVGGTEDCILIDMKDNFLNFGGVDEVYEFFREFWK